MAIGLDVTTPPAPENPEEYDYETCPFYGELSVRGGILVGTVVSTEMEKTVVVEREYDVTVPKYDRQMKRRSRVPAHVPGVLDPSRSATRSRSQSVDHCRRRNRTWSSR